eukprot:COSAG04_NODE_2286_length_4387_cov_1.480392_3_plen_201_part_00
MPPTPFMETMRELTAAPLADFDRTWYPIQQELTPNEPTEVIVSTTIFPDRESTRVDTRSGVKAFRSHNASGYLHDARLLLTGVAAGWHDPHPGHGRLQLRLEQQLHRGRPAARGGGCADAVAAAPLAHAPADHRDARLLDGKQATAVLACWKHSAAKVLQSFVVVVINGLVLMIIVATLSDTRPCKHLTTAASVDRTSRR